LPRELVIPAYKIRCAGNLDRDIWDTYVLNHPDASLFHRFGWREVIHGTYGHATYYLMLIACNRGVDAAARRAQRWRRSAEGILGVLPLVHLKHMIFGNSLVSLPFLDGGGILADSSDVEECLVSEAVTLARSIGVDRIDLRCERAIAGCDGMSFAGNEGRLAPVRIAKRSSKVRMLLKLPGSSEALLKSFKAKLRSQIGRPLKEGCTSSIGGLELLEDFYRVFVINMRDLGSPVHSKDLMRHVLEVFSERSKIVVVYKSGAPIASALVTGFNEILRNPWASSDRKYAFMSPNMLLYSRMLEFACDQGYRTFDFGRSSPGEGTFKFKEQWGAVAAPLHWYVLSTAGAAPEPDDSPAERYKLAARCWSKLPLAVTRLLGPRIRKHISL